MSQGASVDITNMSVMYGGVPVSGLGPGTPLTVAYGTSQNQVFSGLDGLAVFVKSKAKNAVIRVELMPNSIWNDVFSSALRADDTTKGGLVIPVLIQDKGGRSKFVTDASKVVKLPDFAVGDALNVRAWELVVGRLSGFIGGMAEPVTGVAELPDT